MMLPELQRAEVIHRKLLPPHSRSRSVIRRGVAGAVRASILYRPAGISIRLALALLSVTVTLREMSWTSLPPPPSPLRHLQQKSLSSLDPSPTGTSAYRQAVPLPAFSRRWSSAGIVVSPLR